MKIKYNKYFLVILVLISTTLLSSQKENSEQLIVSLSKPDQPGCLNIKHSNGSVKVTGYDGDKVIINAILKSQISSYSDDESNKTIKKMIGLVVREKDNNVTVVTNSDDYNIDLNIKVPYGFSNNISIEGDGTIEVRNVSGELVLSNTNDDIKLLHISGSTVVSSENGNIIAQFDDVDRVMPMSFTTINGKIDLSIPSQIKANIKMLSEAGQILTDFSIDFDKKGAEIHQSVKGGLTGISLYGWLNGSLNGGGQIISAKTVNGNIYLRKNK